MSVTLALRMATGGFHAVRTPVGFVATTASTSKPVKSNVNLGASPDLADILKLPKAPTILWSTPSSYHSIVADMRLSVATRYSTRGGEIRPASSEKPQAISMGPQAGALPAVLEPDRDTEKLHLLNTVPGSVSLEPYQAVM